MSKSVDNAAKYGLRIRDNLIGKKFERLKVTEIAYQKNNTTYYKCRCDCGKEKIIRGTLLKNSSTKSCGCLRIDSGRKRKKHGLCNHPLYGVWSSMKARCMDENNKNYGGRGIQVHLKWKNDFQVFYRWCMKNGYEKGLSLDRINVNKGYTPSNCRFITLAEQNRNKQNTKSYEFDGEKLLLKDIALKTGVSESLLWYHINKGKTLQQAIQQYSQRITIDDPVIYERKQNQLNDFWYLNKQLNIIPKEKLEIVLLDKFPPKLVAQVVEKSQATLYRHKKIIKKA